MTKVYEVKMVPKHDDDFMDFIYSKGMYLNKANAEAKKLKIQEKYKHIRVFIKKRKDVF